MALRVGQFGLEGLEVLAVAVVEVVAGEAGEDLEHSCGGGCGVAAVSGLEREFGQVAVVVRPRRCGSRVR